MKKYLVTISALPLLLAAGIAGCGKAQPQQPVGAGMQALPVQTMTIAEQPVPQSGQYVATIKSRRSATINPQVSGNLTRILVHSGDQVKAGQLLMEIDPAKQEATVASQEATDQQLQAVYKYNQSQIARQRQLFADGIISKDTIDQSEQAYASAKANYDSALATLKSQQQELGYYRITAPFAGTIGDIPVHIGDYVTSSNMLTTLDENKDLEAYVYVPTDRSSQLHDGLGVQILDNSGKPIEKTAIDFISPQVDDALQGILVKAPVHSSLLRNEQLVKAQVIWSVSPKPVVPVLAVSRLGGQAFVYVAKSSGNGKFVAHQQPIALGETVGNNYAVLSGLDSGDKVIVTGTQMLMDGMPVAPMPAGPPPNAPAHGL
ncbi:MAG TPA: efflux RND transporter periplasmic adaptor subunit [Acidobacteriaceae bacterium]